MSHPIVSVVIPVYNTEAYFPACLASVAEQNLREIEIICVDDASPDACGRIMDEYAGRDARLRVLRQGHAGVSVARNRGLAAARGNYVYFMDSDDRISPDFLESLTAAAQEKGAQLLLFAGMFAGKDPRSVAYAPTCALFLRRGLLRDPALRFPPGVQPAEDAVFSHLCLALAGRVAVGGGGTYHYIMHQEQDHRKTATRGRQIVSRLPLCLAALKNCYDARKLWKRNFSALCRLLEDVFYRDLFLGVEYDFAGKKAYAAAMRAFLRPVRALLAPDRRAALPEGLAAWFEDERTRAEEAWIPADRAPRVLVVDILPPEYDRHAGGRVTRQFNLLLKAAGCRVIFTCLHRREGAERYFAALRAEGMEVIEPVGPQNALEDLLRARSGDFDLALLHRPATATRLLRFLRADLDKPVIYFGHDLVFLRREREHALRSDLPLPGAALQREEELAAYREASIAMSPSREEARLLRESYGLSVPILVPQLLSYPRPDSASRPPGERRGLLFVGSAAHTANSDGLRWFLADAYPALLRIVPDCPLHIAGFGMRPELFGDLPGHCALHDGLSDPELDALHARCRVFVAPLRFGAGVKGKVLEAMFRGLPVVGTSTAFEGIPDAPPAADGGPAFVKACARLLLDEEAWRAQSRLSRALIARHFSEESAVEFWKDAVRQCMDKR